MLCQKLVFSEICPLGNSKSENWVSENWVSENWVSENWVSEIGSRKIGSRKIVYRKKTLRRLVAPLSTFGAFSFFIAHSCSFKLVTQQRGPKSKLGRLIDLTFICS